MCGIVGYVGKRNAQDVLLDGLEKLEYRGYDSAGVALALEGGIRVVKSKGRLAELRTTALAMSLLTLAMGNVAFALYDRALCNMLLLYKLKWQPKLHKMLGMH